MAAAQAVLETWELLEMIISYVPVHQIQSLKATSKHWNHLIKNSNPIRRARCVTPVRWSSKGDVPTYDSGYTIELHPKIKYMIAARDGNGEGTLCKRFNVDRYSAAILKPHRGEYATSPRCWALAMCLDDYAMFRSQQLPCVLYVKEGIKVGDILDARKALLKTYSKFLLIETDFKEPDYFEDEVGIKVRVAEETDT